MDWRGWWALVASTGLVAVGAASGCGALENTATGGAGGGYGPSGSSSSSSSAGGSVSSGSGGSGGGGIGASCAADTDCHADLLCLLDSATDPLFGGGPAGGFCTRSCDDDTQCPDPAGVCYKIDPSQPGRCTLSCTIGPAISGTSGLFDPLSPDKCRGREDVRCGKAKNGVGVCLPTCGKDSQCSGGKVCDPRLAVCVDHPNDGLPTGSPCVPGDDPTPCGGLCVGFDSGAGICSSPCVLGGEKIETADCGGPDRGFCAYRPVTSGLGDVGYCSPACQSQSDCDSPDFWCFAVAGLTEIVQRGYCFTATPCPGGQADCDDAGLTNVTCTDTSYGAFCLDPTYPPGGGGTGGGLP